MKWTLGCEEAAGGEEEEGEEEDFLTGNFGEDNRSELSRKWRKRRTDFQIVCMSFLLRSLGDLVSSCQPLRQSAQVKENHN